MEENKGEKKLVRLQKFLAECGLGARRKCEELITAGRVSINGTEVTQLGTKVDPQVDRVQVDGRSVSIEQKKLFLFYKPKCVVTTLYDPEGRRNVGDFTRGLPVAVHPVGRLDFDVQGLLLLTNDGDFSERLLHPRYGVEKVYWALVEGEISDDHCRQLIEGVELEDGFAKAQNCKTLAWNDNAQRIFRSQPDQSSLVELTVSEGRKHFVKRLLEHIGHPVIELCRIQFGPYRLGKLRPGNIVETSFVTNE